MPFSGFIYGSHCGELWYRLLNRLLIKVRFQLAGKKQRYIA